MIKRLFVSNYKCLVNFEYKPESMALIMGSNGTGKTSVFEIFDSLKGLITKPQEVEELFPKKYCTRWEEEGVRGSQLFEIEISADQGEEYRYRLLIDHWSQPSKIAAEELFFGGEPLIIRSNLGQLEIIDDHGNNAKLPEPFGVPSFISAFHYFPDSSDFNKIRKFKKRISNIFNFKIESPVISSISESEEKDLKRNLKNFASWLRWVQQGNFSEYSMLQDSLKEIFPGAISMSLDDIWKSTKQLMVNWNKNDSYTFDELSDGQRILICLYAIIYFQVKRGATVCIDEPDNYVTSREIQPWLVELFNLVQENDSQAIIISHHPEVLDYLGSKSGQYFKRTDNGPVIIKNIEDSEDRGYSLSELIARGWGDE